MKPNVFKCFLYTSLAIIFISLFLLDGGTSFKIILIVFIYVLFTHLLLKIGDRLSGKILGVIIGLICASAPILYELLNLIFPPLKF